MPYVMGRTRVPFADDDDDDAEHASLKEKDCAMERDDDVQVQNDACNYGRNQIGGFKFSLEVLGATDAFIKSKLFQIMNETEDKRFSVKKKRE